MIRKIIVCISLSAYLVLNHSPLADAAKTQQVDVALNKAKAQLYSKMKNGNWETSQKRDPSAARFDTNGGQWGGPTAVAVYALLAAGEDPNDPKLAPSIEWLKKADIVGTYALSMRCQVWLLMPRTPITHKLAEADKQRLEDAYDTQPHTAGLFLYNYVTTKKDLGLVDHSVSQFGVLSMWACAQMGIEIPTQYWADVEKRWTYDQQKDGGWFYAATGTGSDHPSEQASMTAAGVATLYITQDYVHADEGVKCIGNIKNEHIDLGLKWMSEHTEDWTVAHAGWGPHAIPGYTLYGLERIGVASGLKYFGNVDWYQFGADWCIRNQAAEGYWGDPDDFANTALCMLFLARGRAPVLINKMQYDNTTGPDAGKPGPWNQRPRDVANYCRWMGEQTERPHDVNWQISNLQISEDELHDAPFLYFSGNKPLSLKPEEIDKLKSYIEHGGMILFNSDCGMEGAQNPFVASVAALARQMFPDYEFRDIPDNHPMFTNEQYPPARWKRKVTLRGLSNGVRELMIIMPGDPARSWQLQETGGAGHEEMYQSVADLVLYGTDKESLHVKGQGYLIKSDPAITSTQTVKIARLKYDRNWNPEPGGWDRLAALMHNSAKVDLNVEPVELGDKPIKGYPIAHLTGTTSLAFTPTQQQQLKNFVLHGGTLIVDCAGGSSEFAPSAELLLNKLFPDGLKDPLPPKDPLFSIGFPKTDIHYRHFSRSILGNVKVPQLKAIQIGGRNAVYYSRYDLSGGLVGEPIDGIVGYDPDSCSEIMSGIILSAIGKK
jgi:hypothetical protein